jgi:hypothetical protein
MLEYIDEENHITKTINIVLSQSLYCISDIGNNIFTNLIHVTTKAIRSSMAIVLEQTPTTMYAVHVLSFSVKRNNYNVISKVNLNIKKRKIFNVVSFIYTQCKKINPPPPMFFFKRQMKRLVS